MADASVLAFDAWKQTTAFARSQLLRKWFDRIVLGAQEIAQAISQEMGKPVQEAVGEVMYAAGFAEWYAEEAKRLYGETFASQHEHKRLYTTRQPVGPVYAVTPWNFPAAMITRKVGPALAAGCTVVVKPAELTSLSALRCAELVRKHFPQVQIVARARDRFHAYRLMDLGVHLQMRETAGLVDLTAFAMFDITGPGALATVQRVCVRQMDVAVGKVVYTPVLDAKGGMNAELRWARIDAAADEQHDAGTTQAQA